MCRSRNSAAKWVYPYPKALAVIFPERCTQLRLPMNFRVNFYDWLYFQHMMETITVWYLNRYCNCSKKNVSFVASGILINIKSSHGLEAVGLQTLGRKPKTVISNCGGNILWDGFTVILRNGGVISRVFNESSFVVHTNIIQNITENRLIHIYCIRVYRLEWKYINMCMLYWSCHWKCHTVQISVSMIKIIHYILWPHVFTVF